MYKTLRALLLGLILTSAHALSQTPVNLTASHSPPYAGAELPDNGLAMELVNHILTRAGYAPSLEFKLWSRAMEGVELGLYDALASAWHSEERAKNYIYSAPYLDSRLILLKLRTDPTVYTSTASLAGKRIGTQHDYAYGVDLGQIPGLTQVPQNHALQNLLDLLNGEVDVVIGDQRTLAMQIHAFLHKDMHKFQVVDARLPTRTRHLAASRATGKGEKLVADFNLALAASRKDGSYDAIVDKWDKRYPLN